MWRWALSTPRLLEDAFAVSPGVHRYPAMENLANHPQSRNHSSVDETRSLRRSPDPAKPSPPSRNRQNLHSLAVFHCESLKQKFSDERRVIRCGGIEFPHVFLSRVPILIGAGTTNLSGPVLLLRPLSSKFKSDLPDNRQH